MNKYFKFSNKNIKFGKILIGSSILIMIVYILRMVIFFPDIESMKYNDKSILNQIIENKK